MPRFLSYVKFASVFVTIVICTSIAEASVLEEINKRKENCPTTGNVAMSQEFITAVMSFLSPLGVGSCSEGACSLPLGSCPNSTCCLPNYGPSGNCSRCGCLIKNAFGKLACSDPKMLRVGIASYDESSGTDHNVSLQLYVAPKNGCQTSSSINIISTAQGQQPILNLKMMLCARSASDSRLASLWSRELSDYVNDLVADLDVAISLGRKSI